MEKLPRIKIKTEIVAVEDEFKKDAREKRIKKNNREECWITTQNVYAQRDSSCDDDHTRQLT